MIANKDSFPRESFELIIDHYRDKLNWKNISYGTNITSSLVEKYSAYIDWDKLSVNSRFPWTISLLHQYRNQINWTLFSENLITKPGSDDETNCFRRNVLERLAFYLDWEAISGNDTIYFDYEVLETYKDRWVWPILINNPAITWKEELFRKFDSYISKIPMEDLQVSYLWTSLIESHFNIFQILRLL